MLCFSPTVNHLPSVTTAQFRGVKFKFKSKPQQSLLRFGFLHREFIIRSSSSSFPNFSAGRARQSASTSSWSSSFRPDGDFDGELDRLLDLLPEEMRKKVREHPELHQLMEVVLDLGRKPLARFPSGDCELSENPVRVQDLEYAVSQVGEFTSDNRAGISRTLHRISAIRNRKGCIIGLTCRVGRAVRGSADLLRYLVQDGSSLLLIGPPGVGKTTLIREIARMLANDYKKRVMIVDTSNEIGGDGDIPHPGIGDARRMQVPDSNLQHKVLIEAVENHMPQVIVIDEIGTKLEAMAASTIAERGIQLVATAHGLTIENLIMNPSLDLLVGGVQSVTLGDEEATRRGGQKTILERKGPSTFGCGVEIISKTELRVHRSLEATVDAVLSGRLPKTAVHKKMNSQEVEAIPPEKHPLVDVTPNKKDATFLEDASRLTSERTDDNVLHSEHSLQLEADCTEQEMPLYLFVYGITEATVTQGIKQLAMETAVNLTDNISEANALLGLQSKLKKNPGIQSAAKSHGIPIYVTKTSSVVQVTKAIRALLTDREDGLKGFASEDGISFSEKMDALEEARIAIEQVIIPKGEPVELLPRSSLVVSLQAKLVKKFHLQSERICRGSEICLRIIPSSSKENLDNDDDEEDVEFDEFNCAAGDTNGSLHTMDRLPLLPD